MSTNETRNPVTITERMEKISEQLDDMIQALREQNLLMEVYLRDKSLIDNTPTKDFITLTEEHFKRAIEGRK